MGTFCQKFREPKKSQILKFILEKSLFNKKVVFLQINLAFNPQMKNYSLIAFHMLLDQKCKNYKTAPVLRVLVEI